MATERPPTTVETTPSGFEIVYWDSVGADGKPQRRRYRVDGERFDSISSVSGCMDKPALTPAGAKLERQGVVELVRRGVDIAEGDERELLVALRDAGLHYDSIWEVARIRGDVAHDHLLHLIRDDTVARRSDYDDSIWPWIQAGMKWELDARPEWIDGERMVASAEHRIAGRFDLLARFPDGRVGRIDFKTVTEWKRASRKNGDGPLLRPYFENLIQPELYEIAAVESGYPASDFRAIVRLGPDGDYDVTETTWVGPDDALAVLTAYRTRKRVDAGEPQTEAVPA